MILLALLALAIGAGIALGRAGRNRPPSAFEVKKAVLAGSIIAVVRLGLFWTALAFVQRPDWRPGAGHALMLVSAPVELLIASSARNATGWPMLIAALIVVTSFGLGWVWAWTRTLTHAPNPEP
jgi:hypothetical protein